MRLVMQQQARKSGRAKLTMQDADIIRLEAASKKPPSQRSQARRFSVSQMAIWQVLAGRTFKKGTPP